MLFKDYVKCIKSLTGKTIALVYIFENEEAIGFGHYEVWKSDVIIEWLKAIGEISCIPYIIDVKTFVYKASRGTLPHIDFVINLNAGNKDLSVAGLVPSVCSFVGIKCIPCDAVTTIIGEHKLYSNYIAKESDINIPEELTEYSSEIPSICRPYNLGSSVGVEFNSKNYNDQIIRQKFIYGFDVTIPILYCPLTEKLELLPAIAYINNSEDVSWYLNKEAKACHSGYKKQPIKLQEGTSTMLLKIAELFAVSSFCRIDTRIECNSYYDVKNMFKQGVPKNKTYFIEINPTPTIKSGINYLNSLELIDSDNIFSKSYQLFKENYENASHIGFFLTCAMIAVSKAKHYV